MISSKVSLFLLVVALITGCGSGGGSGGISGSGSGSSGSGGAQTGPGSGGSGITGINVLSITVNGSLCSPVTSASYPNKPCVSVTVCNPGGSSTCQTINDILLDTGSFGLRIFKSLLGPAMAFTQVAAGSGSLAECAEFGDGSSLWGPVPLGGVTLASEPAATTLYSLSTDIRHFYIIDIDHLPGCGPGSRSRGFQRHIRGRGLQPGLRFGMHKQNRQRAVLFRLRVSLQRDHGSLIDQVQNPVALSPRTTMV